MSELKRTKMGGRELKAKMGADAGVGKKQKINRHEAELAEKLGGVRQPNSGATPAHKGDVKTDDFLLDSKETEGVTIIVSARDLSKITHEAREIRKEPGLILTLKTTGSVPREWALIPLEVFATMIGAGE